MEEEPVQATEPTPVQSPTPTESSLSPAMLSGIIGAVILILGGAGWYLYHSTLHSTNTAENGTSNSNPLGTLSPTTSQPGQAGSNPSAAATATPSPQATATPSSPTVAKSTSFQADAAQLDKLLQSMDTANGSESADYNSLNTDFSNRTQGSADESSSQNL